MERTDDEYASVAASVTDVEQLSPIYRQVFERVVADALERVFQIHPDDASKFVAAYFHSDGGPSLFAYHRSPTQIAADLSGVDRELTDDEKERYKDFLVGEKDCFGLPVRNALSRDGSAQIRKAW